MVPSFHSAGPRLENCAVPDLGRAVRSNRLRPPAVQHALVELLRGRSRSRVVLMQERRVMN